MSLSVCGYYEKIPWCTDSIFVYWILGSNGLKSAVCSVDTKVSSSLQTSEVIVASCNLHLQGARLPIAKTSIIWDSREAQCFRAKQFCMPKVPFTQNIGWASGQISNLLMSIAKLLALMRVVNGLTISPPSALHHSRRPSKDYKGTESIAHAGGQRERGRKLVGQGEMCIERICGATFRAWFLELK